MNCRCCKEVYEVEIEATSLVLIKDITGTKLTPTCRDCEMNGDLVVGLENIQPQLRTQAFLAWSKRANYLETKLEKLGI